MLILTRCIDETIELRYRGLRIEVMVSDIRFGSCKRLHHVRLGVRAPREVQVLRAEVAGTNREWKQAEAWCYDI